MDDVLLHHALFLLATFAGALVAGLAGFAFGLVAAAVWLHILPPLGGATGFAGIVVTIWSGLRGWPKDVQRTVFQPVGVATFAMTALWLGARGAVSGDIIKLFLMGLPALVAGTWLGLRLYGRLDEAGFRRIVLLLLLLSGCLLVIQPLRQ
jgi:hypothetical protein